jgi:hypothetical protein
MLWTIITAASTLIIAGFAMSNFYLAYSIKKANEEHESKFTDLLEGLIVAGVMQSSGRTINREEIQQAKIHFNRNYKGKTEIFPDAK